jgi:predicted nucleic-acid-binding Zn-ribbon protein
VPDPGCPRCGNAEVLDGVRLKPISGGSVDEVQAVVSPTSGMIRRETASDLRGRVCAACGFTELFVSDPGTLAERWRAGER